LNILFNSHWNREIDWMKRLIFLSFLQSSKRLDDLSFNFSLDLLSSSLMWKPDLPPLSCLHLLSQSAVWSSLQAHLHSINTGTIPSSSPVPGSTVSWISLHSFPLLQPSS
jgi:hypothetical protein